MMLEWFLDLPDLLVQKKIGIQILNSFLPSLLIHSVFHSFIEQMCDVLSAHFVSVSVLAVGDMTTNKAHRAHVSEELSVKQTKQKAWKICNYKIM